MYIGREDQKNISSSVDFTRIFNGISRFTESNIDIVKEGITFLFIYCSRSCKWRISVLTNLQKYVNQIDTIT